MRFVKRNMSIRAPLLLAMSGGAISSMGAA